MIGANAIGLELGQYFLDVGSRVTFFDVANRIAPFEEPEISTALTDVLADRGAQIHAPTPITRVERDADTRAVVATIDGTEQAFTVDQILVAVGRRPNTADLAARAAGIELDDRSAVVVDEHLQTTNPNVYAAGDVNRGRRPASSQVQDWLQHTTGRVVSAALFTSLAALIVCAAWRTHVRPTRSTAPADGSTPAPSARTAGMPAVRSAGEVRDLTRYPDTGFTVALCVPERSPPRRR